MPHFTPSICGNQPSDDCDDPIYRLTHLGECPDHIDCSDPVFAAANPSLCLNTPRLFIKPSAATVQILGEVQYKAFLWENGAETELTTGVVWTIEDITIGLIGAGSGNATGVTAGITTVTATYGSLTATARLEVIASCSARSNHFLMLFDISRSSQGVFSEVLGTRLDVAKSMGVEFNSNTDYAKDDAAVLSFDSILTAVQPFTTNENFVEDAITDLESTAGFTALGQMLQEANAYFDTQGVSATGRVIVLFTDGEHNKGIVNPITVAETIKATGTIIIVVGLRAKLSAFSLLERVASGGFFINVLPSNVETADGLLNGLRQYLCSGNCPPDGGVTVGVGELNYSDWTNWDVTDGEVDLIGKNPGGIPFFDLRPGNGLYMDDHGSGPDYIGEVTSKTAFNFTPGNTYKLSMYIAGNQRQSSTRQTRVQIPGIVDETITRAFTEDFTLEEWEFTVGAPTSANIIIQGLENVGTEDSFGNLIDRVRLENLTTSTVMLEDDFDDENLTFIPPGCAYGGYGYGYGYYGYCYGQGCTSGIPAQEPDPNPLLNMEGEANAAP